MVLGVPFLRGEEDGKVKKGGRFGGEGNVIMHGGYRFISMGVVYLGY